MSSISEKLNEAYYHYNKGTEIDRHEYNRCVDEIITKVVMSGNKEALGELLNIGCELFVGPTREEIEQMIEEKSKMKTYEVEVLVSGSYLMYVKANSPKEALEAVENAEIDDEVSEAKYNAGFDCVKVEDEPIGNEIKSVWAEYYVDNNGELKRIEDDEEDKTTTDIVKMLLDS